VSRESRDDEPFEGVNIELPFVSFRAGRGWWRWSGSMDDDQAYSLARRRVRQKLAFYRHLATYAVVIGFLFLVDWMTGSGWWVQWPAAIWGAVLALQAVNTFLFPSIWSRETEERMIEDELRKMRRQ
jgi:hypothetical protein